LRLALGFDFTVGEADVPVAGDDLLEVGWWPLTALPALAFDHDAEILAAALGQRT
jgi:hypothetical protein